MMNLATVFNSAFPEDEEMLDWRLLQWQLSLLSRSIQPPLHDRRQSVAAVQPLPAGHSKFPSSHEPQ